MRSHERVLMHLERIVPKDETDLVTVFLLDGLQFRARAHRMVDIDNRHTPRGHLRVGVPTRMRISGPEGDVDGRELVGEGACDELPVAGPVALGVGSLNDSAGAFFDDRQRTGRPPAQRSIHQR